MALPNIFTQEVATTLIERLNKLNSTSQPKWGTMNAAQMLAHCNVSYDLAFDRVKESHNFFMQLVLKTIVKKMVTSEKPYKPNLRTSPVFLVASEQDFEKQKAVLIANMKDCIDKGVNYFDGKKSASFGSLKTEEWNNMFYKHLNHHLNQFGV